jgi:outer membrane receptor protein involved in Fe transport
MKLYAKTFTINTLLVLLTVQSLHAQSTMQGTVMNESGQPLLNVNILLLQSKDSALVKGTVSNSDGSYLFTGIHSGSYLLGFTFAGYKQTYTIPYTVNNNRDEILVGETRLKEESKLLNNVTVMAKKPLFEQKIDRLIINVRNSITSAGATALDVLERSPGVTVDRQNNALSMGGKDGVTVMINGKENRMPIAAVVQMLDGMNAGNIERIELITTPPANFNAEGNAGIINIVLKENNNDGMNGSFTTTIGGGKNQLISPALNFNYRKGKINLYGDYSFAMNDMYQVFRHHRVVNAAGIIKENQALSHRDPVMNIFTGRMGVDIQLSPKTNLGATVSGYTNNWSMKAATQTWLSADYQLDTIINTDIHEVNRWKSLSTNLNLYHVFSKDENLTLNLDHLRFRDHNPADYSNDYFNSANDFIYNTNVKSDKLTPIRIWIGSMDYNKKMGKNTDLQAGIKCTFSGFTNDILVTRLVQDTWMTDQDFSANYELNESIQAGYIAINTNFDLKTSMKIGLRYEYTNSELDTKDKQKIVDRHYGKLFPSLFLSRKVNDNTSVNFSYSRRITRPAFNDLAPFTFFNEPNSFITGNPGLQPSTADVVAAGYSYRNYIFSLSYTYEADAIARFQPKIDPVTNRQFTSSENMVSLQTLALTMSIPVKPATWWDMQYNINGRWQKSNSFYTGARIIADQKIFRITGTQTFRLPRNFVFEISGYYQSADLLGRFTRKPFGSFDAGVQKKTGKKGKLSLTVTDIFNTTIARSYVDIPEQNLVVSRNMRFTQRIFKLTYTQSFGNSKLKGKRNRVDSSEEERKRVE